MARTGRGGEGRGRLGIGDWEERQTPSNELDHLLILRLRTCLLAYYDFRRFEITPRDIFWKNAARLEF